MLTIKFLTTLIPEEMYEEVSKKSKYNMQDAANTLQWHLYEGLCKNYHQNIEILNVLPIGSFPQYYKDAFIKKEKFNLGINIGFCNIKLIRKQTLSNRIYKSLIESFKNTNEGILFVYTASAVFMEAINNLKKKKPKIKVCVIIADLPEMSNLSSKKSIIQKIYERYLVNKIYKNIKCIDYYILLTKYMADYLKIEKPFCVLEGIATKVEKSEFKKDSEFENQKVIMYTGTLHKKFGILNLVKAFQKIEKDNYKLIICGIGDSEKEIKKAAKLDNRIKFLGQLPRNEILRLQSKATVLVNPRQNTEEFTKYSFPSKTLEYLSSGIPVIAYKLDGIPDEYKKYLCYVKDNSIETFTKKIIEICELDYKKWKEIGDKGKEFVFTQKNSVAQTKKIVDLLERTDNKNIVY